MRYDEEFVYYGMFADKKEVEKETFQLMRRVTLGV